MGNFSLKHSRGVYVTRETLFFYYVGLGGNPPNWGSRGGPNGGLNFSPILRKGEFKGPEFSPNRGANRLDFWFKGRNGLAQGSF